MRRTATSLPFAFLLLLVLALVLLAAGCGPSPDQSPSSSVAPVSARDSQDTVHVIRTGASLSSVSWNSRALCYV